MTNAGTVANNAPAKKSRLPLLIGLILALVGTGGGFLLGWSGMIPVGESVSHDSLPLEVDALPDVAFVEVEPLVISLRAPTKSQHLRFRAQLEVPSNFKSDVEKLLPRVVDVLNSYLRALDTADLEDPAALVRLRAQMLRRVQVVAGKGRINDLLIMEFVLN